MLPFQRNRDEEREVQQKQAQQQKQVNQRRNEGRQIANNSWSSSGPLQILQSVQ